MFPILTIIVAFFWIWGAHKLADHAKEANSARLIGMLLTVNMDNDKPATQQSRRGNSLLPGLQTGVGPQIETDHQDLDRRQQKIEEIAFVEVTVLVWEWFMRGMAALLVLAALVSLFSRWTRRLHQLVGVAVVISIIPTIVALYLLTDPGCGDMPPLSGLTYLLLALAQSSYGVVLLCVFAHKPKAELA
jgi:hypothetical protein